MKKLFLALFLAVMVPAMAWAEQPLDQLQQAAELGNADAQNEVGGLYEFGYNRPKDNVAALAWYMRAALQGHVLAIKRRDLLRGRMMPEEIDAARKLSEQPIGQKR